ncbi:MAG: TetR/AcrR family transcriptional regulator [Desulfovibrionaceae bacterium]|jgi:AcrR family transcriptional regulator
MTKKEAIRYAATVLFAHKGFQETTMQDICKVTGTAEGTIFYHFKSKEQLLIAILEHAKTRILEEYETAFADREFASGLDMMEEAIAFYFHLTGLMEHEFTLLQRQFPHQLAEDNSECRAHLAAIYNCLTDIFERVVRAGQADGSMGDFEPRGTAMILFAMVDGLLRLKTCNLYEAGALFDQLVASCRRMLAKPRDGSC